VSKAAKTTSRLGKKRARTPKNQKFQGPWPRSREHLRQTPLVERKKKLRKLIERSQRPEILFAQHIERHGK
jgi:hypothetical protein